MVGNSENMSHFIFGARKVIRTSFVCGLFLLVQWGAAETKPSPSPSSGNAFSNVALGFKYVPPAEMRDKTQRFRAEIHERAEAAHTKDTLDAVLAMSSGPDDKATDWHSLTIETYPRKAVADLDDASAEAKMSAWVAHSKDASALPRSVVLSGQSFAVSIFGLQEGTTKKGAVVWTTVRKDKLLSFAFVANSPEQLKRLAESMKSVQFF
jgi:hypothetical protein